MVRNELKKWLRPLRRVIQGVQSNDRLIWSGIYSHFDQVPRVGTGFEGFRFAEQTRDQTSRLLQVARNCKTIPTQTAGQDSILPLLAAIVVQQRGAVNIIDFGGGTGTSFVHVVSSLPSAAQVSFDVIETPSTCEIGRELFSDEPRIRFHTTLPELGVQIDILHISSALQYVADYRTTLSELCGLGAEYFLLAKLSAAEIPTYATSQQVYDDMAVPYWFLNINEVVNIISAESYRLLWTGSVQRKYDQSNFPRQYRMGHACNLLFRKGGESL